MNNMSNMSSANGMSSVLSTSSGSGKGYPYPQLEPPPFRWQDGGTDTNTSHTSHTNHTRDIKVHQWIRTIDPQRADAIDWSQYDVTILGVPLSRSSISASAASENPDAMRRAWQGFVPYSIDYDVDLTPLRVVDLGNVRMHVTDIALCHQRIREAMLAMRQNHPHTLPLALGGDHSITAMLVKGWHDAHPDQRIGLLQFDTHFDLRSLQDDGPSNGTPVRNLIESGTLRGEDVWNIGLHGFFNGKSLKEYADQAGVHYVTLREMRRQGLEKTVETALRALDEQVDTIYLTVDMDVLDIGLAPGAPAATPGGMRTDELFAAVYLAGQHHKVRAMDIVCLDPLRDVAQSTVKAGVHVMLSFLTGVRARI